MKTSLLGFVIALLLVAPAAIAGSPAASLQIDGAQVTRLAAIPSGDDVLVAAGAALYQHDGDTWQPMGTDVPDGRIVSAGDDSRVLLVGDHAPCMRGGASTPLARSTDGGVTWTEVPGVQDLRPLAIWIDQGIALGSTCAGLQISRDEGLTWSAVPGIEPGWDLTSVATIPQSTNRGPIVLVGLTGEGGTSFLRQVDLTDPESPVVSGDLRTWYATAGLAGQDDTYLLAAIDGVWISRDAGESWTRSASGLDDVVLARDPLEFGLPADMTPDAAGLFAALVVPGDTPGMLVGSVDGVYYAGDLDSPWQRLEGTSGKVTQLQVSADGSTVFYVVDDEVYEVILPIAS